MSRPHHHGTRPVLLASRTRKARRSRTCVLCGGLVIVGQTEGLLAAGWAHTSPCIVEANRITRQEREQDD